MDGTARRLAHRAAADQQPRPEEGTDRGALGVTDLKVRLRNSSFQMPCPVTRNGPDTFSSFGSGHIPEGHPPHTSQHPGCGSSRGRPEVAGSEVAWPPFGCDFLHLSPGSPWLRMGQVGSKPFTSINFLFWNNFRFTEKLRREYREFPCIPHSVSSSVTL